MRRPTLIMDASGTSKSTASVNLYHLTAVLAKRLDPLINTIKEIGKTFFYKAPIKHPNPYEESHSKNGAGQADQAAAATADPLAGQSSAAAAVGFLSRKTASSGAGGDGDDPEERQPYKKKEPEDFVDTHVYEEKEIETLIKKIELMKDEDSIIDIIRKFLKSDPHKINSSDRQGNTLLHIVTNRGLVRVMRFLLENRADPNLCNENGEVPITIALAFGELLNLFASEDNSDELEFKETRIVMVQLLIRHGAELYTHFCGALGHSSIPPLESVMYDDDPEMHQLLHRVHHERRLEVLKRIWQQLAPELKIKFRIKFLCIANILGVTDVNLIIPDFKPSEEREIMEELEKIKEQYDPEYWLSQLLQEMVESILNSSHFLKSVNTTDFDMVSHAGYMLIEFFRELSLSSVDVAAERFESKKARIGRYFVSFYKDEKKKSQKRLHRLPHTLVAVLRAEVSKSSPRKLYLGRTAGRALPVTLSKGKRSDPLEHSCRTSASPRSMSGRLSSISSCSGGSSDTFSLEGSRTPQQCAEFQAFTNALNDNPDLEASDFSFVAVEIGGLVCQYNFKSKQESRAAAASPKPPCMNCRVMYSSALYQGSEVRFQFVLQQDAVGVIQEIEELEEIAGQLPDQVVAIITVLNNDQPLTAQIRLSSKDFISLERGVKIRFDLWSSEKGKEPLMIFKGFMS